jgi:hypothetical protein
MIGPDLVVAEVVKMLQHAVPRGGDGVYAAVAIHPNDTLS